MNHKVQYEEEIKGLMYSCDKQEMPLIYHGEYCCRICGAMFEEPDNLPEFPHYYGAKEGEYKILKASEAARALGSLGGKSTSEAKRKASRENGKRGGRPKEIKE